MSGFILTFLVEAEDATVAKAAAETWIDSLFDSGDLQNGDAGFVDQDAEVEDVTEEKLRDLNQQRIGAYQAYIADALKEMERRLGVKNLADVPLEEASESLVGYYLKVAGEIQMGDFTRHAIVYDPEQATAGFKEDRIKEIVAKGCEHYKLVEAIVG